MIGVAGAGKTTVRRALALRLGPAWTFADADVYHALDALARMARGEALTDADRAPWLARLRALVGAHLSGGPRLVLACSALRAAYRETLHADDPRAATVWLDAPGDVLAARLARRLGEDGEHPEGGNPVGPSLLPSQLATFEPPGPDALRLDATQPPDRLADAAAAVVLGTRSTGPSFGPPHLPHA